MVLTVMKKDAKGVKGDRVIPKSIRYHPYEMFRPQIKLHGKSYEIVRKGVWYSLVGNVIKGNTVKCGSVKEDTRINLFIPMKSGYGKLEFEKALKKNVSDEHNGFRYAQPTSYHPEQLIGKTIMRGNRNNLTAIQNYGYLHDDFVCFDEAIELFRKKDNQDARDYIAKALDPIGDNEVMKRGVDVLPDEEIRYCPNCTMVFFFQPVSLGEDTVLRGLFRRGIIIYPEIPESEREEALSKRLEDDKNDEHLDDWLQFLKNLRGKKFDWQFLNDVRESIEERSKKLIKIGDERGGKSKAYTDIMFFTLQNFLIKMSVIQAAINNREIILEDDVQNAYEDLKVFWISQLDFVTRKIDGQIDYEDGLLSKESYGRCIDILKERECYSLETSKLSIQEYLKYISETLSVKESSARLTYYANLKDKGVIDSKQIGSHDSRVWLVKDDKQNSIDNTLTPITSLSPKRGRNQVVE